jgi:hypothetical protein
MRNIEAGFSGFLAYDEGVLFLVNKVREEVNHALHLIIF